MTRAMQILVTRKSVWNSSLESRLRLNLLHKLHESLPPRIVHEFSIYLGE